MPLDLAMRVYGQSDKWLHGYAPHYRTHLSSWRRRDLGILEIGVGGYERHDQGGGSLRVWRDCFPRASVVGFDLHAKTVSLGPRVTVVRGDQTVTADLDRAIEALGRRPDLIIDDGSHLDGHAAVSFEHLFPLVQPGGIYVIEDLQTSYSVNWGGAIPAPASTAVGLVRSLVDAVQVQDPTFQRRPQDGPAPSHWAADVAAVHVYPGIAFITKS